MKRMRNLLPLSVFLLSGVLAACGPADGTDAGADGAPQPSGEPEGTVLGAADLVGIEEENVVINLHWVGGLVNRDPPRLAPPVTSLAQVSTMAGSGFDRTVFHFDADGLFPGYDLTWREEAPVDCATGEPVTIAGQRHLRVRLRAVNPGEGGSAPGAGHPVLTALSVTCSREGLVEWHLGTADSTQVRVLELRAPPRLVVDVRHPR